MGFFASAIASSGCRKGVRSLLLMTQALHHSALSCMIRLLGPLGRCVGPRNHATGCFTCYVCCGRVLGYLYDELELHLHLQHYIVVVTCSNCPFSSLVCLLYLPRSCGEPRPTSLQLYVVSENGVRGSEAVICNFAIRTLANQFHALL